MVDQGDFMIIATFCSHDCIEGIGVISFCDAVDAPENFIIFQREKNPSESDVELGMDKMHVQLSDELRSGYDFVSLIKLEERRVVISLTEKGRKILMVDGEIVVDAAKCGSELDSVIENLRVMSEATGVAFVHVE